MSDSPLRAVLLDAMNEHGCSMKDLTVLANQNDPFRIDTPAGHRDGEWLAMHADRLGLTDRTIHLRGLHYRLMSDTPTKPNGEPYRNIDPDWRWLQDKAADAARWLGYIPFDRIVDQRNAAPFVQVHAPGEPHAYLSVGLDLDIPHVDDLRPEIQVDGFDAVQPYRIVLMGEKHSLHEGLEPVAQTYGADLYLPTGEPSDTMLYQMARTGAADGRPMVVLYFSDCDPSGWQMPISVARKLQAFRALAFHDLNFEVYRVALTPEQVRDHGLPSTPMKSTERRADRWQQEMGVDQTEIDSLAALRPDLLNRLALDAIAPFYDSDLDLRVFEAKSRWLDRAQEAVEHSLDHDHLDRIRAEADARLEDLRDQLDAINDALRIDTSGIELPPFDIPTARIDPNSNGTPLLDSRWPFADQCRRLIDSKAYLNGGGA